MCLASNEMNKTKIYIWNYSISQIFDSSFFCKRNLKQNNLIKINIYMYMCMDVHQADECDTIELNKKRKL